MSKDAATLEGQRRRFQSKMIIPTAMPTKKDTGITIPSICLSRVTCPRAAETVGAVGGLVALDGWRPGFKLFLRIVGGVSLFSPVNK